MSDPKPTPDDYLRATRLSANVVTLAREFAEVRAEETERCAGLCEARAKVHGEVVREKNDGISEGYAAEARACARHIRTKVGP